jgi:hypothetical protein
LYAHLLLALVLGLAMPGWLAAMLADAVRLL